MGSAQDLDPNDITIDCAVASLCNNLVIHGSNLTGDLSFGCDGISECSNNEIWCPEQQHDETTDKCKFVCGDIKNCESNKVYAQRGTDDINWYCGDNMYDSKICNGSVLKCGMDYEYERYWIYSNQTAIPWKLSGGNSVCYGVPSDPDCDYGINSFSVNDESVCCSSTCGNCYDEDSRCAFKPGGLENCCTEYIRSQQESCDINTAPCVITPTANPTVAFVTPQPSSVI